MMYSETQHPISILNKCHLLQKDQRNLKVKGDNYQVKLRWLASHRQWVGLGSRSICCSNIIIFKYMTVFGNSERIKLLTVTSTVHIVSAWDNDITAGLKLNNYLQLPPQKCRQKPNNFRDKWKWRFYSYFSVISYSCRISHYMNIFQL